PEVASISTHSSTPKPEQKCKNIRAVNTIGVREEYTAGGPTNTKLVRGTRSGPMVAARFKYMHLPLMIGSFQTPQARMMDLTKNGSGFVKRLSVNSPSSTPSEIKESGVFTVLQGIIQSVVPTTKHVLDSSRDILLCLRILSALILEEGEDNENDDIESNDYQTMSMDNKLLIEIQSIRLCPELMEITCSCFHGFVDKDLINLVIPDVRRYIIVLTVRKADDEIDKRINDLENKYHEQVSSKASMLDKLLKTATEAKALQEKESKQDSIDKHTVLAYQKYMSCYGPKVLGCKSVGTKLAKKQALATIKQILEHCHEFEMTSKISFTDNESG
nr:hypothetical protein [Tanacetum cinerariifolium]